MYRAIYFTLFITSVVSGVAQAGVNRDYFEKTNQEFQEYFADRIFERYQYGFAVEGHWNAPISDEQPGAYNWVRDNVGVITVHGGLARDAGIDEPTYVLVLCHELGHFLRPNYERKFYQQNELQADRYAANECFVEFVTKYSSLATWPKPNLPQNEMNRCEDVYPSITENLVCQHGVASSMQVALYVSRFHPDSPSPAFDRRAEIAADFSQCTLEAYLAGLWRQPMPPCYEREE